jgi:hypothetical protein
MLKTYFITGVPRRNVVDGTRGVLEGLAGHVEVMVLSVSLHCTSACGWEITGDH